MKGICIFQTYHRERSVGVRPYELILRLTPECELFERTLLDVNKSGTAEAFLAFVSCHKQEAKVFSSPGKEGLSLTNFKKYRAGYFTPPEDCFDWVKKDRLDKAPIWCSVDLRDGNQALITPMNLKEKVAFYKFLLEVGFKEIEVGFPAASDTEYEFLRTLIDRDMIPDDVTIQVLSQSRPHIIEQTFESIRGAKNVIMHLYNSTSFAQRQQVFRKSEEEIIEIAEEGARLFNKYASQMPETNFAFEYSPESFTGTEPEFALRICNAVIDIWNPSPSRPVIINLPATVEMSMPHVYAQQIAYVSRHLHQREHVIVSVHPHNDRGTGVAAAELGLLAGGQRVEGTLFGNGERTGNVDIITLAMNLYTHGVNPELEFSDMPQIVKFYEEITGMSISQRHPYSGQLVFAAFSGSHQDAIAKGMQFHREQELPLWTVPYLPLDPSDVNREYESDVIRINSQSGKGGISFILEHHFGYDLPDDLQREVGYFIKGLSDSAHKELEPQEILDAFQKEYVNICNPVSLKDVSWQRNDNGTAADITLKIGKEDYYLTARGNGPLDAVSRALRMVHPELKFSFEDYAEHALEVDSDSKAAAYVKISDKSGKNYWGAGVHEDIILASVRALISALNRANRLWQVF
jgi:2-isopropylmalate synthase